MKSIVVKIKALAASERRITAEILDCIREIEAQKIHFEMGYPGLLEFLVQECGYSESAAFRRINAARLTGQVPGLRADLQSGSLTLTQVSTAARGFRQKEKLGKKLSLEEKADVLSALKNKSSFESQQITAKLLQLPVVSQDKIKPQSDESVRLEMSLSKEEMELAQRAREILGHVSPGMSWKELLVFMARDLIKRRDPAREFRAKAQKPSKGKGQDKNQDRNRNQAQNQNQNQNQSQSQNHSQRRSQSQCNNPNKIQEQGLGDETLLKLSGLNLESGHFDDTTQVPLASAELASAQLVLSSGLFSRASAPELAPPPVRRPTPKKNPALERRSSATLARWVNLSSPTPGAQILGAELQEWECPRCELVEAEPFGAELPGSALVRAELSETGENVAEVPGAEQPRVDPSGAEEIRFSSKSATPATSSSTLVASAHSTSTVSASLRRLVFRRDQRCQWLDPVTGRKCGSRHLLELDHIHPRWAGGLDEPLNLRLLCRSHNNLKYRLEARTESL